MKLTYKFKYTKKNKLLDDLCVISNNLYNQANYLIKQESDINNKWLRYNDLDKIMKVTKNRENEINYRKLKVQISQQLLRLLDANWLCYFRALKNFKKTPNKYKGMPKPPNYKKSNTKNLLIYTNQCSKIKNNQIILSKDIKIDIPKVDIDFSKFQQIRVLPKNNFYEIEIIYNKERIDSNLDQNNYLSIDLGIDNLITCISKDKSFILSGKTIKSVNQHYNKQKVTINRFQSKKGYTSCSNKLNQLSQYRNDFIKDQFHKMSRLIVNYCLVKNISIITCGYNKNWKDSISIGKINNQKFTAIPYRKFINYLKYKCELVGIKLIINEESYTSKCDSLALESIEKYNKYLGKRVHRGLFQSSVGKLINADVNGSFNILRKVIGDDSLFIKDLTNNVVLFNPIKIRTTQFNSQTLLNSLIKK